MGQYALGLVQKKSEPALALARFDEAARLAADVHNFWWEGIALMEAASTRGVHGDPAESRGAALEDRARRHQSRSVTVVSPIAPSSASVPPPSNTSVPGPSSGSFSPNGLASTFGCMPTLVVLM